MPLAAFPKCFLEAMCVERSMSVDDWIDLSAELDVDGLEFYWGFTPWQSPAELERIRRRVADQGRSIPMMCYSPDFTQPDPAERQREVVQQIQALHACAALGAGYCRVLSGQSRPGVSRRDGVAWAAQCIQQLLPAAEQLGLRLVLENHYKDGFWKYPEFAQKLDVFLDLLHAVGETPWLGVNYDPSNALVAGEDPLMILNAVKHRVLTMHASDRYFEGGTLADLLRQDQHPSTGYASVLRHGVIGRGLNDYDRIFAVLRDAGFRGWISIEDGADPEHGLTELRASAVFLRGMMNKHHLTT